MKWHAYVLGAVVASVAAVSCLNASSRGDGLDVSMLPADQRADYDVFAQRCSKCHSLARPLQSGIDSDDFWAAYVEKMRRMPSSGISPEDTVPILRFLHRFSESERTRKEHRASGADDAGPTTATEGGVSP
jgi:hypothetical protein